MFLTPSKTDGRVPSQQGAPTTCNLITGQLGCGHRAKFSPSLEGGRGWRRRRAKSNLVPKAFPLKNGWGGKSPGDEVGQRGF